MMRIFVLEDSHSRMQLIYEALGGRHEVTHAKTVADGKRLWSPPYDLVLLDHDLSDEDAMTMRESGTGTEFANWIAEGCGRAQTIIHSYNLDGARRMEARLKDAAWPVQRMPFGMTLLRSLEGL